MRIKSFKIENFRNLRLVECLDVPDLVVICGPNGCGKSALLEALIVSKEIYSSYKSFRGGSRLKNLVSANALKTKIKLELEFADLEIIPKTFTLNIEFDNNGNVNIPRYMNLKGIETLLKYYSSEPDSPGFFEFISPNRRYSKKEIKRWSPDTFTDNSIKETLVEEINKFQFTKEYLASLKMRDLQILQKSQKDGNPIFKDSLEEIRTLFNQFFNPMKFEDVNIYESPFEYVVSTPLGKIDIDELSSGEKEIFNQFVRIHQLKPINSIILFDEIDAHLHPELIRKYYEVFK